MKRTLMGLVIASTLSMNAMAHGPYIPYSPYGPFNQQFTYNQGFSNNTPWSNGILGAGVAQAGVLLVGGLVNALSQPSQPQIQQTQPQVIYVRGNGQITPESAMPNPLYNQGQVQNQNQVQNRSAQTQSGIQSGVNCRMTTVYNQQQQPLYVKICE